jgi:hypothetical protein
MCMSSVIQQLQNYSKDLDCKTSRSVYYEKPEVVLYVTTASACGALRFCIFIDIVLYYH